MYLTQNDKFVLRLLFLGRGHEVNGLDISPFVKQMLTTGHDPATHGVLQTLLGEQLAEVFKVDPNQRPTSQAAEQKIIAYSQIAGKAPRLPKGARLSDEALKAAEKAGAWLDESMAWATQRSPMTPDLFLLSGFHWLIGLAIAGRVALKLSYGKVNANMYALWVADTSRYRKSTGLEAIRDVMKAAFPHLKLSDDNTPEALISQLAGTKPPNFDSLKPYQQSRIEKSLRYGARRGILLDEAATIFSPKEYMKNFVELLMRIYDGYDYERNLRSGVQIIENPYVSILGATTPSSLFENMAQSSYTNGMFARMEVLTPEKPPVFATVKDVDYDPPASVVSLMRKLEQHLPAPPSHADDEEPEWLTKWAHITPEALAAHDVYSKAVGFDLLEERYGVDHRLHGNYARAPYIAMSRALQIAVIDWATRDFAGMPTVDLGCWARAQQYIERVRESAHRALNILNQNSDAAAEERIIALLRRNPSGLSLSMINRQVGAKDRKSVKHALEAMYEGGLVDKRTDQPDGGGRPATKYLLPEVAS